MAEKDWVELSSTMIGKQAFVDLPKDEDSINTLVAIEKVFFDPNRSKQVLQVREYGKADSWYILFEAVWKGLLFEKNQSLTIE